VELPDWLPWGENCLARRTAPSMPPACAAPSRGGVKIDLPPKHPWLWRLTFLAWLAWIVFLACLAFA